MQRRLKCSFLNAPTSSGSYTPEEESKQLNTPRLLTALLRLKRLEDPQVKVEKSLDGSSIIYVMPLKDLERSDSETSIIHGSPWTVNESATSLDSIIQRLRIIAESQKEVSTPDTPPQKLQVSLDSCTLFYIPAETIDPSEGPESLPNSNEGQTPNELYYNLTSPHALKFIQRALMRSSQSTPPNSTQEFIVQESLDKSIIVIHPKGPLPKGYSSTPMTHDISRPELAEILKRKLEELTIEGDVKHAIDDDDIQIITLNYSPNSFSGSQSSKENSTPILSRNDYPNLLSPKTNLKLLRKLHEVQEDLEGEDEGIRDIEGYTTIFMDVNEIQPIPAFQFSPLASNVPTFQEVVEKLARLKKRTYSC